jgi:hypothetical protein
VRPHLAVIAFLLTGVLASCGQCGSSSAGNQHLVFTGPVAGTLTNASTDCIVFQSQSQANFQLTGTLGGKDLLFHLQIHSNYGGPGTYQVGSLLDGAGEIRLQIGADDFDSSTGAGIATILGDGRSGTVSANLSGGEHVEGRFACDKLTSS